MRSILEKAFVALLNEEHDKAEEMFHKFIVERARQIHESNRAGEDFVLDENWEEEITTESYFTEEDLADLEDGEGDEEGSENPFAAADEDGAEGDMDMGDAEGSVEGDFGADDAGAQDAGEQLGDDLEGMDDGSEEPSMESLEDKIDDLVSKFDAMMDALGGDEEEAEGDFGGEDDASAEGDMDMGDDAGVQDSEDADAIEDDMDGAVHEGEFVKAKKGENPFAKKDDEDEEEEVKESEEEDDDFDGITESIIDELEKVQVTLVDGKEIGTGSSFTQNKSAAIPQKSKDARMGGEPIKQKVTNHKGFARETAPTTAEMKARRNTLKKADSTQSSVSKEGDASAEINKIDSNGNTKSLTPGGKPGFKAK